MPPRNQINKEKQPEQTIHISQLREGHIVKFKGTRDKHGYRMIHRMSKFSYSCFVLIKKHMGFDETGHMSVNGIDKLTHLWTNGVWLKIVQ